MPDDDSQTNQQSGADDLAARFLIDRINYERTNDIPYGKREFKLDRMRKLLDRLANPQNGLRVIHVAGSKGKGSTSTMVASILTATGLQTGLFTSPHLLRLEERFQIDGVEMPSDELSEIIRDQIEPVVRRLDLEAAAEGQPWDTPTFFEIVTAVALLYFRRQSVDVAVLEVGLGGRLDSTNVCQPECCVITSISLDHTRQLGDTHAEIASEKAGILKRGVPLVTGVSHPDALETITNLAKESGCPQFTLQQDFDFSMSHDSSSVSPAWPKMDFKINPPQGDALELGGIQLGMWGEHQAANAAVATMVAHVIKSRDAFAKEASQITERAIRTGLRKARCPARIEVVSDNPLIVVDTAHNEASVWALTATLNQRFPHTPEQRTVVFATSRGKEYEEMLDLLAPWAGQLILTRYQNNPRSVSVDRLASAVEKHNLSNLKTADNPEEALRVAIQHADANHLICVTGSFFLAAEVLELIRPH